MLTARPATIGDAAFLLRLRNDPATIAASRVASSVAPDEHATWLAQTLTRSDRWLRVVGACDENGEWADVGVGTYRLDALGPAIVEMSLTVAPERRSREEAWEIIRLACLEAAQLGFSIIEADVRRDNARSLVAFIRAGFLPIAVADGFVHLALGVETIIRRECPRCIAGEAHHTNAASSIGGAEGRAPRYDLHVGDGGGLTECQAGDLWLAWERGARARRRSTVVSHQGGAGPPLSTRKTSDELRT